MPASIGLMVLSRPIIRVLFERGEFTPYVTDITSNVLFFYAFGLIAYGGIKVLVAAFHSMQDTITPVKVAFFALLSNIILNIILMVPLKAGGLALATSIAGFINASALFVILRKRIGYLDGRKTLKFFLKVLFASLVMGIIARIMMCHLPWNSIIGSILNLFLIIFVCILSYVIISLILKITTVRLIFPWIKKD
jgi:putative peptidoglycan lipid II flippase